MVARGCSEPGCREPHVARGFCHRHYRAFLRQGGKRKVQMDRLYGETDEDRFWHYVERGPRCWEWTGYKNEKGYGVMNLRGQRVLAHRFAYQMQAQIPEGLFVLHHCDNPACVRFRHLFVGSLAQNNADMFAKGRGGWADMRGEKNNSARISEADVKAIRASTAPVKDLAKRYGTSRGHIYGIKRRIYWPHIE